MLTTNARVDMSQSSQNLGEADHEALFAQLRQEINQRLADSLNSLRDRRLHLAVSPPKKLLEAMRYSLLAGGKRLRPLLVLCSCQACGGDRENAWPAALAVEYIHTYSLIHDDLPAMDDDDMRRGRPTLHKAFDEATALLAGDGLLTDAFSVLAKSRVNSSRMVLELAMAAGACGMVGGQMLDVEADHLPPEEISLEVIHRAKTGRLFVAAAVLGGLAAAAPQKQIALLRRYGATMGHAFQVADDLLDVVGDPAVVGKNLGRDSARGKFTYVTRDGVDQTRAEANRLGQLAKEILSPLGPAADPLKTIVNKAVDRVS